MQNSLCVQVLRTARHSTSGRQPNFVVWYKEWNYGTFTESPTYTRQGGHHIGHRPTHNTIQRRRSGMSDVISHAYALVKISQLYCILFLEHEPPDDNITINSGSSSNDEDHL